jgi:hypothetical protein
MTTRRRQQQRVPMLPIRDPAATRHEIYEARS